MAKALYIYDGECLMCSRFVRFLVRHDADGQLQLATAQSEEGRAAYRAEGLCPDEMSTAIFKVGDKAWINLDVFTEGLAFCGWPWRAARILHVLPAPISNWLYRRVANNRKLFNSGTCPMPTPEMRARMID